MNGNFVNSIIVKFEDGTRMKLRGESAKKWHEDIKLAINFNYKIRGIELPLFDWEITKKLKNGSEKVNKSSYN